VLYNIFDVFIPLTLACRILVGRWRDQTAIDGLRNLSCKTFISSIETFYVDRINPPTLAKELVKPV